MSNYDNPVAPPQDTTPPPGEPGVRILAQFIRDLSFENPRPPFMIDPIDFQGIYFQRKAASENPGGTA